MKMFATVLEFYAFRDRLAILELSNADAIKYFV